MSVLRLMTYLSVDYSEKYMFLMEIAILFSVLLRPLFRINKVRNRTM